MISQDINPAKPSKKSRPFQFSIAQLLVLTTIFSIMLSLFKWLPESLPAFLTVGCWGLVIYLDIRFVRRNRLSRNGFAIVVMLVVALFVLVMVFVLPAIHR